jgi:hypothetical protein
MAQSYMGYLLNLILWHVDLLLGNDREIRSYTIVVAK